MIPYTGQMREPDTTVPCEHYVSVCSPSSCRYAAKKVITVPSSPGEQSKPSPDSLGDLAQVSAPVARAIETFAAAAGTRRIENICKAYQTLKSSINGLGIEQVLPLADKVLGQSAIALVVSAYSHERCFMCMDGSVTCENCSEEDVETQTGCLRCNSTGLAPCEFCDGTGWVGNDVIPRELRRAVWLSRLKHTHHVLEKYARTYTPKVLDVLSRRPAGDTRRRLAIVETIRLAAKMHALGGSSAVNDPEHLKHLTSAEQKVRMCLTMLAWQ